MLISHQGKKWYMNITAELDFSWSIMVLRLNHSFFPVSSYQPRGPVVKVHYKKTFISGFLWSFVAEFIGAFSPSTSFLFHRFAFKSRNKYSHLLMQWHQEEQTTKCLCVGGGGGSMTIFYVPNYRKLPTRSLKRRVVRDIISLQDAPI